jgi:hypothetical protein
MASASFGPAGHAAARAAIGLHRERKDDIHFTTATLLLELQHQDTE